MTLAEIAAALELDERTVRRTEHALLAKLRAGFGDEGPPELVVAAIVLVLRERDTNYSSTERTIPRRFSSDLMSSSEHAPHVATPEPVLSPGARRAGLLSRFPRRKNMKNPAPTVELEAESALFPIGLSPTSADIIAQYAFIVDRLGRHGYGNALAATHERALNVNEQLAALLRSQECLADIGEAAGQTAQPPSAATHARAAAIARYKLAVAEQLAKAAGHPLAKHARAYIAAVHARELAEAEQRRQGEERAAEAARVEAERRAKEVEAEAAREAEEQVAEEQAALALLDAVADAERERIHAVVALRRRLRASAAKSVRIGRASFNTRELSLAVGNLSVDQVNWYLECLDSAEARAGAHPR